jgi:DNA repair exonuclease SbcCD ATPase subunit
MRNMKLHSAHAENILCFGPEGVNFHFCDYGQVIQIKGINLDNPGTKEDPASNGAGKSSVQEILSLGLFGRTVKSPTKLKGGQFLNASASKAHVEVQWDDYRVVRTYKRSSSGTITGKIQVWESKDRVWDEDSEVTKGGTPAVTQKWIEERLGLNHHTFCNIVIFDDSNFYSFLEADAAAKREFVENLLGLDQYRKYHENAKALLKIRKKSVDVLGSEYNLLCSSVESCERRIQTLEKQEHQWKNSKKTAFMEMVGRVKSKQASLENTNTGEQLANWQKGQDRISELTNTIEDKESKIKKVKEILKIARESFESAKEHKSAISDVIQQHNLSIKSAQLELDKQTKQIAKLDNLEDGAQCPVCLSVIKKDSYGKVLKHSHDIAEEQRGSIRNETASISQHSEELAKKTNAVTASQKGISEAEGSIALFEGEIREYRKEISKLAAISKPEGNSREQVLEAEISELRKQAKVLKEEYEGNSPYAEILVQAQAELIETKSQSAKKANDIYLAEEQLPYYQFWVEAFGDKGIRRYVVDGIIPALNARIAYWLSYLIDSKIELVFNNELTESITRNGNSAFYYAMSNGERRRINLAVSQAFSYVMMLNSGCCPSLVFLDEITGGGIDKAGIVGIYNMIFELAKERQVFVTTHNENLMSMLQGCETLTLKKENDITVLSS